MNLYLIQVRWPGGVLVEAAQVTAGSYGDAIRKAKAKCGKVKDTPIWRATLVANRTGKNLGRYREIDSPERAKD